MATSTQTYDLVVDHTQQDRVIAAAFGRFVRKVGLRPWLEQWSLISRPSVRAELTFAQSASRWVARLIGPAGISPWDEKDPQSAPNAPSASRPTLAVLSPGCPVFPRELPVDFSRDSILDLREGFEPNKLVRAIAVLSSAARAGLDPARTLAPAALKRNVITSYNVIAEKFAARWFHHPPLSALERFLGLLPRRALVLDVGCGPGHHACHISERGHQVFGVDISENMLRIARSRVRSVQFARMDMQALTFPPQTFDAIWCAGAAMHVPREEIVALLLGFRQLLRPAGVLGLNLQVGRPSEVVEHEGDRRFFEYYRDRAEIAALVTRAGLAIVDSDYGETTRNTHGLNLTLGWVTIYAVNGRFETSDRKRVVPSILQNKRIDCIISSMTDTPVPPTLKRNDKPNEPSTVRSLFQP